MVKQQLHCHRCSACTHEETNIPPETGTHRTTEPLRHPPQLDAAPCAPACSMRSQECMVQDLGLRVQNACRVRACNLNRPCRATARAGTTVMGASRWAGLGGPPAGSNLRGGHCNDAAGAGGLQQPQHVARLGLNNDLRRRQLSHLLSCNCRQGALAAKTLARSNFRAKARPCLSLTCCSAATDLSEASWSCACIHLHGLTAQPQQE